jgi:hypothetical protein
MPEREEAHEKAQADTREDQPVSVDLRRLYAFAPSDLSLDIASSHYSNLAYVQVTHRDVYIDFLEMPGTKRDGKMAVKGVRIYMSHPAAKRLAEVLGGILEEGRAASVDDGNGQ